MLAQIPDRGLEAKKAMDELTMSTGGANGTTSSVINPWSAS